MINADFIKARVRNQWPDSSTSAYCEKIVDFIVNKPAASSKMLSYSNFSHIGRTSSTDPDLIRAVGILSSRFDVLIMHFVLVDDSGESHYLDDEEVPDFIDTHTFVDPQTGKKVERLSDNIYPYYEGNREYLIAECSL